MGVACLFLPTEEQMRVESWVLGKANDRTQILRNDKCSVFPERCVVVPTESIYISAVWLPQVFWLFR